MEVSEPPSMEDADNYDPVRQIQTPATVLRKPPIPTASNGSSRVPTPMPQWNSSDFLDKEKPRVKYRVRGLQKLPDPQVIHQTIEDNVKAWMYAQQTLHHHQQQSVAMATLAEKESGATAPWYPAPHNPIPKHQPSHRSNGGRPSSQTPVSPSARTPAASPALHLLLANKNKPPPPPPPPRGPSTVTLSTPPCPSTTTSTASTTATSASSVHNTPSHSLMQSSHGLADASSPVNLVPVVNLEGFARNPHYYHRPAQPNSMAASAFLNNALASNNTMTSPSDNRAPVDLTAGGPLGITSGHNPLPLLSHTPVPLNSAANHNNNNNNTAGYSEHRFTYSVNGMVGTPAQSSAAAAFFARASAKLSSSSSTGPSSSHRRKRHGSSLVASSSCSGAAAAGNSSETDDSATLTTATALTHHFRTDFTTLLRKCPPPLPASLLRRLGGRENPGVGKVRVILRVGTAHQSDANAFLSLDKKRKQVTLLEPSTSTGAAVLENAPQDRRIGVAAPKMFAFDGLFSHQDPQSDIANTVLSDIVTAVINGSDGCVFGFGHAKLGKTHTMVGCSDAADQLGLIPCAIAWLFRGISEQKTKTGARFSVRVSAVEVAGPGEILRDLLASHASESEQSPGVYLRDDPLLGTQLQNQSELRAPTLEKAAFYFDAALAARSESDTRFSHLLYTLHVYQYSVDRSGSGRGVAGGRSRLHLLDLGSCCNTNSASAAGVSSGLTLSALGNVLVALFNGQRHLPHREHKVTQVLRECLGSLTCQAAVVAHVAPQGSYSETLATVQMASRIHRMRRRRIKYAGGGGSGGSGSGGSSEESRLGPRSSGEDSTTSADPSSSEQSCDTVIYVGPIDDATDGEHPPVYLPSLNSGDNRCAMSKALRGSLAEDSDGGSVVSRSLKTTQSAPLVTSVSTQSSPSKSAWHKREDSPSSAAMTGTAGTPKPLKITSKTTAVISVGPKSPQLVSQSPRIKKIGDSNVVPNDSGMICRPSDEQWVDGPRIQKSKVVEARNLARQKKELWVDGPSVQAASTTTASTTTAPPVASSTSASAAVGYGYMDEHKKGMIRQWVETQSAQVAQQRTVTSREVWIDSAPPVPAPTTGIPIPPAESQVRVLTMFKTCEDEDEPSAAIACMKETDKGRAIAATIPKNVGEMRTNNASTDAGTGHVTSSHTPFTRRPLGNAASIPEEPTLEELCEQVEQLADALSQGSEEDVSNSDESNAPVPLPIQPVMPWRECRFNVGSPIREEDEDQDDASDGTNNKSESGHTRRDSDTSHDFQPSYQSQVSSSVCSPMSSLPPAAGGEDLEYIEVEEPEEPVPMQDSCLQVTEEDIALCMMGIDSKDTDDDSSSEEHPLRVLSAENLTIISHFTGETYSQGTASEWEPMGFCRGEHAASYVNLFELPEYGRVCEDLPQAEVFAAKFDQLARLHRFYQEAAKATPSTTLPPPHLPQHIVPSLKDLPMLSRAPGWGGPWPSHLTPPTGGTPKPAQDQVPTPFRTGLVSRNEMLYGTSTPTSPVSKVQLAENKYETLTGHCRRNSSSIYARVGVGSEIGLELERELGLSKHHTELSSLRHPDGASNPHLNQHAPTGRVYEEIQPEKREPGNGASNSDPEEEPIVIQQPLVSEAQPEQASLDLPDIRTVTGKSDGENEPLEPSLPPPKTPKLSRFFGGHSRKRSKSPATPKKAANTATAGTHTIIVTPPPLRGSIVGVIKSSPKSEKRSGSKSRDRESNKHSSPSHHKSNSRSPSRNATTGTETSALASTQQQQQASTSQKAKSFSSRSSKTNEKEKSSKGSHKSPKKEPKDSSRLHRSDYVRRDIKAYGFTYESNNHHHVHHHHHASHGPGSLCPSEGYESGGSDSGVHVIASPHIMSPAKVSTRRHASHQTALNPYPVNESRGRHLTTNESPRKGFSSGTSTGGSGGSGGHYESSGYESVMRDSECSSLGSSQDSDREAPHVDKPAMNGNGRMLCGRKHRGSASRHSHYKSGSGNTVMQAILPEPLQLVQYGAEEVARFDRRRASEAQGSSWSKHQKSVLTTKKQQAILKAELAAAKRRLGVPAQSWSYELHVEGSMDYRDPSFLEALERETYILSKRVAACKSHILIATCFDGKRQSDV